MRLVEAILLAALAFLAGQMVGKPARGEVVEAVGGVR